MPKAKDTVCFYFSDSKGYVIVCKARFLLWLPMLIPFSEFHKLKKKGLTDLIDGVWIFVSAGLTFTIAH